MKYLHLLAWILCANVSLSFAADTLKLSGANDIRIVRYLQEYVDCSCNENAGQVMEKWRQGSFREMAPARVVNRGVTNCNHWFALVLHNESPYRENYLWSFYNDGIHFTLYEPDPELGVFLREGRQSHYLSLSDRSVPLRAISFPLPLEAGETKSLLLKTEVFGRQNLYFPTDISTQSDILAYELEFSFLLGRYYGFFFFAIIFNLCLYVVLKKRFYAMMLGYTCSLLAFNMVEYLHDVYLIPDVFYIWWAKIPKLVFLALTLFFNVHVFMTFVQQHRYFPKLGRLMELMNKLVLATTGIFLLLHVLLNGEPQWLQVLQTGFVAVLFVQTVVLLLNIGVALRKGTPYIWHYLLGNSLLLVSVTLYLLNAFNILYLPQFVKPGNIIFAFCVESIYLMIVFTVKYKQDFERFANDIAIGEEKRKRLATELVSVQERERTRVARDIHDGVGGTLQGLRLLLSTENLKAGEKIGEMLRDINGDFKRLIHQMAPRSLENQGFFGAIRANAGSYGEVPVIHVQCIGDEEVVPWDMKINIFRIYQELMTNVLKHAKGVSNVEVDLAVDKQEIRLMVVDDGKGTESDCLPDNTGMGMQSIRSRVDYYGGNMDVLFSDKGCSVIIILPLDNTKEKTDD